MKNNFTMPVFDYFDQNDVRAKSEILKDQMISPKTSMVIRVIGSMDNII